MLRLQSLWPRCLPKKALGLRGGSWACRRCPLIPEWWSVLLCVWCACCVMLREKVKERKKRQKQNDLTSCPEAPNPNLWFHRKPQEPAQDPSIPSFRSRGSQAASGVSAAQVSLLLARTRVGISDRRRPSSEQCPRASERHGPDAKGVVAPGTGLGLQRAWGGGVG